MLALPSLQKRLHLHDDEPQGKERLLEDEDMAVLLVEYDQH